MLIYEMSYFTVYSSMTVFRGRGYARPQAELDCGCRALVGLLEVWEEALRGSWWKPLHLKDYFVLLV